VGSTDAGVVQLELGIKVRRAAAGLGLAQLGRKLGQQGVPHLRPARLPDGRAGFFQ